MSTTTNDPQKLVIYILPMKGPNKPTHKALSLRRTVKNAKGRYVTGDQVALVGLEPGPANRFAPTRDDLAREIGKMILDEAGV